MLFKKGLICETVTEAKMLFSAILSFHLMTLSGLIVRFANLSFLVDSSLGRLSGINQIEKKITKSPKTISHMQK